MIPARTLGFLALACTVVSLPLMAAQDATPPPAAAKGPSPRDLRKTDETFLQFEGATVKAAYEQKKAAVTRLAEALRTYARTHEQYLPANAEQLRETDPELARQIDLKEFRIPARKALLLDTNPATAKLFMWGDSDTNGLKTLVWTDTHFRILYVRSSDPAVAAKQDAERAAVTQGRVKALGAQIDQESEQAQRDILAKIKAQQAAQQQREDAMLKGKAPEFRAAFTRKKLDLKQFALEARMYALDHGDKYPEDLGALVQATHFPDLFKRLDVKRFEFVGPSRDEGELFRRGFETTVVIRERDFDPDGMKGVIYADGHVEIELSTKQP